MNLIFERVLVKKAFLEKNFLLSERKGTNLRYSNSAFAHVRENFSREKPIFHDALENLNF